MGTAALIGGGLSVLGGVMGGNAASKAGHRFADLQRDAARRAAAAAAFRPVGITTGFGQSQFGYDDNGRITSAGYELDPRMKEQQDRLFGASDRGLRQFEGSFDATAPMGDTAQTMFDLGQSYLSTSPQEQAAKYYQDQMNLLQPGRDTQIAQKQAQLQAQGRGGLAMSQGQGMMAANPEMAALYNAQQMQDLGLAARATQGGMDYANFGADMVGGGSDMLKAMYGTQTAAYNPYSTALGGAATLEDYGSKAMDTSTALAMQEANAGVRQGGMMMSGAQREGQARLGADSYSPWGAALSGAGGMISGLSGGGGGFGGGGGPTQLTAGQRYDFNTMDPDNFVDLYGD